MATKVTCFAVRAANGAYVGHGSSIGVTVWTSDLRWAALYDTRAEAHAIAHELSKGAEVIECEATLEREDDDRP